MLKYLLILLAYLLGSIPFSYILGSKIKHEDIRKYGSGNIGTSNAFRVFGKLIGISVLILDTLKAGLLVFLINNNLLFPGQELFHPLIYGFASVLGHVFPVWFKFKGGKGVACAFGLLVAYSPITALAIMPMFILITVLTRYVSLASTFTTLTVAYLGVFLYIFGDRSVYDLQFAVILFLTTALVFIRHKSNFDRIRKGTENKVGMKGIKNAEKK